MDCREAMIVSPLILKAARLTEFKSPRPPVARRSAPYPVAPGDRIGNQVEYRPGEKP